MSSSINQFNLEMQVFQGCNAVSLGKKHPLFQRVMLPSYAGSDSLLAVLDPDDEGISA